MSSQQAKKRKRGEHYRIPATYTTSDPLKRQAGVLLCNVEVDFGREILLLTFKVKETDPPNRKEKEKQDSDSIVYCFPVLLNKQR